MQFEIRRIGSIDVEIASWSPVPPDAILLPGANGGMRGYLDLCDQLNQLGVVTIAMNPRQCGASTGQLTGLTLKDLANDILRLQQSFSSVPVVLIGHAGGNRIARMAATISPGSVKALVLLAAGGFKGPDPETEAALAQLLTNRTLDAATRRKLTKLAIFAPASKIPDSYFAVPDRSFEYASAFVQANKCVPLEDWWGGGRAHMLVLQGADDRVAPVENGKRLLQDYPDRVELVNIPDAGHALHLEKPEEIAGKIVSFIETIG